MVLRNKKGGTSVGWISSWFGFDCILFFILAVIITLLCLFYYYYFTFHSFQSYVFTTAGADVFLSRAHQQET